MRKLTSILIALLLLGGATTYGATISGHLKVCLGASRTTLTIDTVGGTWSSGDVSKATIDASTGVVTGVAFGTALISYNLPALTVTTTVTVSFVNLNMGISAGISPTCVGSFTTYTATPTSGNNWTSSNTSVGTINTGGNLSGLTAGTTIISYRHGGADCYVTLTQTVNPVPTVNASTPVCGSTTQTMTATPAGGTWASSNVSVGTINSSTGVFSSFVSGTTNVSYTAATGCRQIASVSVTSTPAAITGNLNVCFGQSSTLASAPTGQTWSSGNTSVATVNPSTGSVLGVGVGVANISYTNGSGCYSLAQVTVSTGPNTGDPLVCVGQTVTLSNATVGGTWSSSNPAIASVGSGTGVVSGLATGVVNITYSVISLGCTAVTAVTVNPAMTSVTGELNICVGSSTTLAHASGGGTWSSSNAGIATAGLSTGIITGLSGGVATISYSISSGCVATAQVTVNVTLSAITGVENICISDPPTTFTHPISGGTWSSSNTAAATVGSSSGEVTAVAPGTTIITYSLSAGCYQTAVTSVRPLPYPISGDSAVCNGASLGLVSYPESGAGGIWTSSNTTVATIGTASGIVTGVSVGTTVITYTKEYDCYVTRVQTVNVAAASITGLSTMCGDDTLTFVSGPSGGTWSSTNAAVVSVDGTSGFVTAVIGGTATIRYSLATGCESALTVNVLTSPAPLVGTLSLCVGNTTTLTSTTSGGTWSSGDITKATVSSSGVVTGVAAGTAVISYTHGSTGCVRTAVVTVNAAVVPSIGDSVICYGNSTNFSNTTGGGYWTSNNLSVAHVNSSTGVVTGWGVGVTNINYVIGTHCYYAKPVTVNGTPAAITGSTNLCVGTSITLGHPISGGTWVSENVAQATVGSTSGIVTGVSTGTTIITYYTTPYCFRTVTVAIYPSPGTISGTPTVCVGSNTILTNSLSGGSWSSSDTTIANVYISSGSVAGVSSGVATITYSMGSGCFTTMDVTVNPAPGVISGTTPICAGLTATYTNSVSGGTWTSDNTAAATIDGSSGLLTAVTGGVSVIRYTLSTGCQSNKSMTVNNAPATITGTFTICSGTTTLSSATTGATWTSTNGSVASIGSSTGVVTPVGTGTTTISYTNSSGCATTVDISVNAMPGANTGASLLCVGSNATLSNATSGGTWSTSNSSVATVDYLTGVVTSAGVGNANISYSVTGVGCYAVTPVTVNAALASITGSANVCIGSTITLSHATGGGTWSSSDVVKATIGSTSGVVSALSAGAVTMTYSTSTGCYTTKTVMVNSVPASIGGTASVCPGTSTTLTNAVSGGSWSSSIPTTASIHITSGILTGVSAGTTIITYVISPGCFVTREATVNPLPASITGTGEVCAAGTTTLSCTTPSGTWTSGTPGVATIGSATGVVTGVSTGTSIVSYILGTGCYSTITVSVGTTPAAITGTLSICNGSTTTLSSVTTGGTWSSSNTSIATTGTSTTTSVLVSGTGTGVTSINYTKTGCTTSASLTVDAAPSAITGDSVVCAGNSTTLSCSTSGGTWSSSNATIATASGTTGVVNGVSAGIATITYTTAPSCFVVKQVTVNGTLAAISGSSSVCLGYTTNLTNAVSGGSWSSSAPAIGSVSASGVVSGLSTGSFVVTYSMGGGCYVTRTMVVYGLPSAISGSSSLCVGYSTALSSATSGGTWSSANSAIASANSTSGMVTGVTTGSTTITYTAPTGCFVLSDVTVNPIPGTTSVSGSSLLCAGSSITLINGTSGGFWISGTSTVATVDSASGIVSGVSVGTANISYVLPTGCYTIFVASVNGSPSAISGTLTLCNTGTTTLSSSTSGGTWSSSSTSVATVGTAGSTSTVVTATGIGNATISYTNAIGCSSTAVVTVSAPPGANTGTATLCVGSSTALTNATGGGTWSSSLTSKATVGVSTGIVNGVGAGTSNITYSISGSGCYSVTEVTVDAAPASITGTTTVCVGSSTTLSHSTTGGTWVSSNAAKATVGSTSGIVTGVSSGTVTITYYLTSTCFKTITVTIQAGPSAIGGTLTVCPGSTTALSNSTSGGTWSSSNATVAVAHLTSGLVYGYVSGTATISYILSSGCYATAEVSVNSVPGGIGGTTELCAGNTTTLTATPGGGTWSSSTATVGTIGASSGVLAGITGGTTRITYSLGAGCITTTIVSVGTMPSTISGTANVCVGSTTTLSSSPTGGTWSSANSALATTGTATSSSTTVTGVSTGVVAISYTRLGCVRETDVTVNAGPGAISGDSVVCAGNTLTLTNATSGGTWTSSNTSRATVGITSGIVTGGTSAGVVTITYRTSSTCFVTKQVTVTGTPAAITGSTIVCLGYTTTLTHPVSGGSWSSSNTSRATIDESGVVTGLTTGSFVITYSLGGGCYRTFSMLVYGLPSAITGTATVCAGSSTYLSSSTSGGTWSSSNTAVGTVYVSSGAVAGISEGTTTITYRATTGCFVLREVTVNATPGAISGTTPICAGTTVEFTNATDGGSWSSSNTSVATIGTVAPIAPTTSGYVSAITGGVTTISYVLPTGCRSLMTVTVNNAPTAITGSLSICVGGSATLSSSPSGGTWSVIGTTVASIGSSTGLLSGLSAGSTTVSYMHPTSGCARTANVTINSALPANTGSPIVCVGQTTTLSNSAGGGTWTSSVTSKATVSASTGVVTGVATGTSYISYNAGAGCFSVTLVSVNPVPSAISGTATACPGETSTLSHGVSGGTWSSSNTNATVDGETGVVTGVNSGVATITYSITPGCYATVTFVIKSQPAAIGGTASICPGTSTTLSDATSGGTWSSSSTGVATIGSTSGVATGVAAGTSTITYRVTSTTCYVTQVATVYPIPAAPVVTPSSAVICSGSSALLTVATSGTSSVSSGSISVSIPDNNPTGAYTSLSLSGIPSGAVVTGVSATINMTHTWDGDMILNLTAPNGNTLNLFNRHGGSGDNLTNTVVSSTGTTAFTSSSAPFTGTFAPTAAYAVGPTAFISNVTDYASLYSVPNGTWTLSGRDAAGADLGVFTSWDLTITYVVPSTITWAAATGLYTDAGLTTAYTTGTDADSVYAYFTASGTSPVTHVHSVTSTKDGCSSSPSTVSVTYYPVLPTIGGPSIVCVESDITLTNSLSGGTWTSGNTEVATVNPTTGVVTGITAGTAVITYYATSGCYTTTVISVGIPDATISGGSEVCVGSTLALGSATSGGSWISGSSSIATVDGSGVVTGITAGSIEITYSVTNSCGTATSTHFIYVDAAPSVGEIVGLDTICKFMGGFCSTSATGGFWATSNSAILSVTEGGFAGGVGFGTAFVYYIVTNSCGSDTGTHAMTVRDGVLPNGGSILGASSVCTDASVALQHVATRLSISNPSSISGDIVFAEPEHWGGAPIAFVNQQVKMGPGGDTLGCGGFTTDYFAGKVAVIWRGSCEFSLKALNAQAAGAIACVIVNNVSDNPFHMGAGTYGASVTIPVYMISQADGALISEKLHLSEDVRMSVTLDTTSVGSWESSAPSVASVGTTGMVTGVSSGSAIVSYYTYSECGYNYALHEMSVNPTPEAGTITGGTTTTVGGSLTLVDSMSGGTWSSSNTSIATVGSTGIVTGVSAGTVVISYTVVSGECEATATLGIEVTGTSTVTPCTVTYSDPGGSCASYLIIIQDFSLYGESGTSISDSGTGCDGTGYQNRVGIASVPTLAQGGSYTAGIRTGPANNVFVQAWIDYDDDGTFGSGETIGGISTPFVNATTFGVTVSESATPGSHIMRVRLVWYGDGISYPSIPACGTMAYGEAHDYLVTIASPGAKPVIKGSADITSFSVAPNPTTGRLTVSSSVSGAVAIYTIDGRQLDQQIVSKGATVMAMPNNLASGVYMLRFKGDDGSTQTVRLVYQP
jgi:subtilisin-like proprotein convertase family protein/uncharacterized protein YjdB